MKKSLLTTTQLIEGKFPKYVKDSKHRISRKVESNEIHKQIDGTRKKSYLK